jgi:GH24 family phage-related lysozyme (muramidase)
MACNRAHATQPDQLSVPKLTVYPAGLGYPWVEREFCPSARKPKMNTSTTSPNSTIPSFEREKWEAERSFRDRELSISEQQQKLSEAELELKRAEYVSSRWKSPLIVAILAATVAAFGNALVSYINATSQINVEAQKSEQARILEMIKTGSPDKAAENLRFLLEAGLITDTKIRNQLTQYLSTRKEGSGPALPSPFVPKDLPDLLSKFESASLKPYTSAAGVTVIGTGHVLTEKELRSGHIRIAGTDIPYKDGITEEQARVLLDDDLRSIRTEIDKTVTAKLTTGQRDALVSFVFNVGIANFKRSSLLRKINEGKYEEVPDEMIRWIGRQGGGTSPYLIARRKSEATLWKKP